MLYRGHRTRANTGRHQRARMWRHARQVLALVGLAVMFYGSLLVKVEAAAGDLDTTFSTDGKQSTSFGRTTEFAEAIAIQTDGKIVVVGSVFTNGAIADFALARYNTNGTLDTTFSTDGKQTTDFSSGGDDRARAVAIQSDGKIVVAGNVRVGEDPDFAVARYNSDGTLDMTFSGDGRQTTGFFSGSRDEAQAIAIQADGRIVLAGAVYKTVSNGDFALARYLGN